MVHPLLLFLSGAFPALLFKDVSYWIGSLKVVCTFVGGNLGYTIKTLNPVPQNSYFSNVYLPLHNAYIFDWIT